MLLDMGEQPLAERMGEDAAYPLALLRCGDCTLVQLSHIVDQREMFPPDHPTPAGTPRRSGITAGNWRARLDGITEPSSG